ncbi:MAG: Na+/H+ antiporter NhaC family protein [Desulfovibrionaceae bacterium]|nr:Na+/H+ antiporter NhaC family protein [Desulfovibrionaceae bacterium]
MEAYYAGWLSILPPVIAIVLALATKEVFFSLMVGILSGTLIYSIGTGADNVVMSTVSTAFETMGKKVDFNILVFCTLLGALVFVVYLAGGSKDYGRWATKRIKSKRSALVSTSGLSLTIFIDDYFSCLTVGTVMSPITDSLKVSRAKLAYIIDATAAPICIIAPVSSWAAAVSSSLATTGTFPSEMSAFVAAIPFNFYALLSLAMVFAVACFNLDFGPMARSEARAAKGELGNVAALEMDSRPSDKGGIAEMVVPILSLIVFACLAMLYNGGYWGADPKYHTIAGALGNCSASQALVWASFGALTVALIQFVPRGLMSISTFLNGCMDGMKAMLPANIILVLAWTISGVCRDLLSTPAFVQHAVSDGGLTAGFLPAIIFLVAAFLSFSTGTAWGTFGILIPIVIPVAEALDPNLLIVCLSATLAGSIFGDHSSPISDTTILASAGSGCNHIEHVSTQLPYAILVAVCCFAGYIVAGLTGGSFLPSFLTAIVLLFVCLVVLHRISARRMAAEEAETAAAKAAPVE